MKRKNEVFALACILTIIIIVIIGLLIANPINNSNREQESIENEEIVKEADEDEKSIEKFEGEFITLEHPTGWDIKEYMYKDGFEDLNDTVSEYDPAHAKVSGLTGLSILDEEDNEIFKFIGVAGIGGTSGCELLPYFKDTSEVYIEKLEIENNYFDPPGVLKYIDLTNENYTEIEVFGQKFRRIDNELFASADNEENSFNAQCSSILNYVNLDGIGFNVGDYNYNTYYFQIATENEDTLEKLDEALNSIELI